MLWYMALVEHLYMIEQSLSNAHVSHNSTYTKKLEFISCFFQNCLLMQKCLNIFKHLHKKDFAAVILYNLYNICVKCMGVIWFELVPGLICQCESHLRVPDLANKK